MLSSLSRRIRQQKGLKWDLSSPSRGIWMVWVTLAICPWSDYAGDSCINCRERSGAGLASIFNVADFELGGVSWNVTWTTQVVIKCGARHSSNRCCRVAGPLLGVSTALWETDTATIWRPHGTLQPDARGDKAPRPVLPAGLTAVPAYNLVQDTWYQKGAYRCLGVGLATVQWLYLSELQLLISSCYKIRVKACTLEDY